MSATYIAVLQLSRTSCTIPCTGASAVDFDDSRAIPLLPSVLVDTNESLRQRALRLVAHGVSQKVLAGKMGMTPSTFSRWLNQKDGTSPASVKALDRFNAYVQELRDALADAFIATDLEHLPNRAPAESHAGLKKTKHLK